jgi:hypothetical protein
MQKIEANLFRELERRNAEIKRLRQEVYEESLGVKAVLYKSLPQFLTIHDLLREQEVAVPEYNILIVAENGSFIVEDIAELGQKMTTNIDRKKMEEIVFENSFCGVSVLVGEKYLPVVLDYARKFGIKI